MLLLLLSLLGVVVMGELSLGCRFFIAGGRNRIHTEEGTKGEDRGWSARASRNQTGWTGKTTRVDGAWRVAGRGESSSVEVSPGSSLPLPLLQAMSQQYRRGSGRVGEDTVVPTACWSR